MVRLLLVAFIAIFAVIILQRVIARIKPEAPAATKNEEKMHKCEICGLHVPESTVLNYQQKFFCSETHKLSFIETQSKDAE